MQKPSRPTGVTILAVLEFIVGIFALLGGTGALVGSAFAGVFGYGALTGLLAALGVFLLLTGILALIVGWGMWTGKGWAWAVGLVLAAIGIVSSLVSLPGSIISIVIDLLIIYYLTRPHIKAYFGKGQPAQTMAPASPPHATTP